MKVGVCWLALIALVFVSLPGAVAKAAWLPALAYATAPECPKHAGVRELRSEIIQRDADQAFFVAASRNKGGACESTATLHLKHGQADSVFDLPAPATQNYSIVDFSSDRSTLLLARDLIRTYPDEQLRNILIGTVSTDTGQVQWQNAWDLFKWQTCDATVEPQGFSDDGKIVVLVRPSVMAPRRRESCIASTSLYEVDTHGVAAPLPDSLKVVRYATVVRARFQACAADPDLVGACFTVHGRLSYWNGNPSLRIGWIGTKRILGVPNEVVPDSVAPHLNFDVGAYGDYRVCPLTLRKPDAMQMVCIEAADNVKYAPR